MASRVRADQHLVACGLFESRAKAQDAIEAGLVSADGVVIRKASEGISTSARIKADKPHPWVSRGGVKLAFALDHFAIAVAGRTALDVGASTGGFSHVLLSRQIRHVTAVDVGHGQLHPSLHKMRRLTSLEGTDIRNLSPSALPQPPDLVVMDVSFIPLAAALPPALAMAQPGAASRCDAVILIKPQFEAGKTQIGKGGIVKDPEIHARVCRDAAALVSSLGWQVDGVVASPITGGQGNLEFLLAAHRGTD